MVEVRIGEGDKRSGIEKRFRLAGFLSGRQVWEKMK
jgi:hypothetical protein